MKIFKNANLAVELPTITLCLRHYTVEIILTIFYILILLLSHFYKGLKWLIIVNLNTRSYPFDQSLSIVADSCIKPNSLIVFGLNKPPKHKFLFNKVFFFPPFSLSCP